MLVLATTCLSLLLSPQAGQTQTRSSAPSSSTRRALFAAAVPVAAAVALPARAFAAADDDDFEDANDLIPGDKMRELPKRKKPGDINKSTPTAADVKYAYADLVAARAELNTISRLVASSDFLSAAPLLGKPPFSNIESSLLTLVQGPGLGPEAKKDIGTIKRYGVGADVIIMFGGLAEAVTGADASKAKSFAEKAKNALDEVLLVSKDLAK